MDGSSNILRRRACFPTNETNNKEEEGSSAVDSTTNYSNSTVQINPPLPGPTDTEEKLTKKKKMKKKVAVDVSALTSSSLSSSSIASSQRGTRVEYKRRNPRVRVRRNGGGVDAIGHPLGISVAAVMALVLYGKDTADERMSTDHLSSICTSAVRESLANVFGDKLDGFTRNFEQSFGSTLRTIRSINDSSVNKEGFENNNIKKDILTSECVLDEGDHTRDSTREDDHSKATLQTSHSSQNRSHNRSNTSEEVKENILMDSVSHELALPGQTNQVVCFSPISPGSVMDNHMVTTFEKSVMEQTRCNDLKTLEIGLAMKKLNLKETQLALNFDSNHLERSKLAMGISKASFKAEKFRNQLEDMRHADLLRNCLDCLVTGLLVMSSSLSYGAYVYSYERITEATASCIPSAKARIQFLVVPKISGLV
ncbi:Protein CPR-5 [Quillaja saponaria]|uniref:Protein CPR-5 n=1 Tax=Quillaja saponaria TaxID=32244 RepID=A0AAD7KT65_QUISA|nr:Protein CPR-5 [Quillaja saponaria]